MEIVESKIDADVIEKLQKEKIDLAVTSDKEMNRCLLNYLAESLSLMQRINSNMEKLYVTMNMAYAEETTKYFEEFRDNFKREESNAKVKKDIEMGHKKKVK